MLSTLQLGRTYTWSFNYIDGGASGRGPGMGPDTAAASMIFQVHAKGGCGAPTVNLGFTNASPGDASTQEWYLADAAYGNGFLWTGAYTPGETDTWTIQAVLSTSGSGSVNLYRNDTLVYSGSGLVTACNDVSWWNFGPYKWRWELPGGGGSDMTSVNATIQNMTLTEQ